MGEMNEQVQEENKQKKEKKKNSKKKVIIIALCVYLVAMISVVGVIIFNNLDKLGGKSDSISNGSKKYKSEYRMSGNSVEKFDLSFLQALNTNKNIVNEMITIIVT